MTIENDLRTVTMTILSETSLVPWLIFIKEARVINIKFHEFIFDIMPLVAHITISDRGSKLGRTMLKAVCY